mmetsp:Transcript_3537/g.4373  ORF Transcript_3537/g.4373 Transcript_3537/m.4373 type:complete len:90 (-) Transcript_3537:62-331(-)
MCVMFSSCTIPPHYFLRILGTNRATTTILKQLRELRRIGTIRVSSNLNPDLGKCLDPFPTNWPKDHTVFWNPLALNDFLTTNALLHRLK